MGPLVPESVLSSQKIFPQEKKKDNCKNEKKGKIQRKNSNQQEKIDMEKRYDL
jgi:hypothetical protein